MHTDFWNHTWACRSHFSGDEIPFEILIKLFDDLQGP